MGFFDIFKRNDAAKDNKYNKAFFKWAGGLSTNYDSNATTYIDKGYNINPLVYSVVNQVANKTASIPFYIKKVDDKQIKSKIDNLIKSTNYNLTPAQELRKAKYESKAYDSDYKELPLERPNPLQTWVEFIALYETFMSTTGNAYIYLMSPKEGANKGVPIAWYLLPSHLMEIHIKTDVDLVGIQNPIDYYTLSQGQEDIRFEADSIVHVKYSNPNFDEQGQHLYGVSPLRACLKNIESSNELLDLSIKTHKNAGVFGFIHSKGGGLLDGQAKGIKDKILEMDASNARMSNILATSGELGFTRMSLTTDELKPFEYLQFDAKQICNALGWDDKLMGNDAGAKYDNYNLAMKKGITGKIMPDLKLLEQAINSYILPLYKECKGSVWQFDISEVPEMQQDMEMLVNWSKEMLDRGAITRNEFRLLTKFVASDDADMDVLTVNSDIMTLSQSLEDLPTMGNDTGL